MLRRSPIFVAADPAQVSSGLQPDKHPVRALLWESAASCSFYSGKVVEQRFPELMFGTFVSPVRGLGQQRATNGVRWVWAAVQGNIVRWYGPDVELIEGGLPWHEDASTLYDPTFWDFTHYGDWTIYNSGIGKARLHKPGISLGDFGDAPSAVLQFTKKLNFILAIGWGLRGTQVSWSDADNVESWTPTTTNLAGELAVEELNSRIKACAALGSAVALYGEDQLALLTYIGAPFYFGQRVVLSGIGAVGKMAVASDGKSNVGVGRGGIWWTDGNSFRYIDEGFLHDYLQREVNWDQAGKIFAIKNDWTGCFEFHFPMRDSLVVNEGWSFDPRSGGWGPVYPCSLKQERRLFDRPLHGAANGEVRLDQYAATSDVLTLRTRPLLMQVQSPEGLGDAHTASRVDEVELLVKRASYVQFRLGSCHTHNGLYDFCDWIAVDEAQSTYKIENMPDGVYWRVEFRSTDPSWELDLQGFLLFGVVEGTKRSQQ